MKKTIYTFALVMLTTTMARAQIEAADGFAGGTGASDDPYQISTAGELAYLANQVNEGNSYSGTYFMLTNDIQLNDISEWESWNESTEGLLSWTPIGNRDNRFGGTFDGQGHAISGIYINTSANIQGLFGNMNGTVQNLGVEASYIVGGYYVGSIAGWCQGKIFNCYNTGNISGYERIGGIAGQGVGDCNINNCYNSGDVTGEASSRYGGIVGSNNGNITNCYNIGNVNGGYYIGGIAGDNYGNITNCYYQTGCATDGSNTAQNGVGTETQGATLEDGVGQTEARDSEAFASGEVCWLLNGNTAENPAWFQNLDNGKTPDAAPVLDSTHGTVYAAGGCPNKPGGYSNTEGTVAHTDSDGDGLCNLCGMVILKEPDANDGVYQISNRAELFWFAALVNGTLTDGTAQNAAANAVLTADIVINDTTGWKSWDASTKGLTAWVPMGTRFGETPYTGTFDGQGHTISGLYISSNNGYQGFFGCVSDYGSVRNLGITQSFVYGWSEVGSIAGGIGDGAIVTNCYNTGNVSGASGVGGVVGGNWGSITHCYNTGKVSGIYNYVGSITGYNNGNSDEILFGCYYLAGTAVDGNGVTQNGAGAGSQGATRDDIPGQAAPVTAEQITSGELCWLLNGQSDTEPVWFQNLDNGKTADAAPVLDSTHGKVYATKACPNATGTFSNTGPSAVGDHADADGDCRCDYCGTIVLSKPNSVNDVYQISNVGELYWFAGLVNGTLTDGTAQNRSANAELTADIVINNPEGWENWDESTTGLLSWTPIGTDYNTAFQGSFDGKGHTISGIYVCTAADYQGLFGVSNGSSSIQNVGIESGYIKGGGNVGGIAADNGGTIANCYNAATIVGGYNVCGIANNGTISKCYNIGLVNSGSGSGIAGYSYGTVVSCYYLDTSATGGIAGSDAEGMAEARSREEFASGEVCWLLNGCTDANPVWFQTLEEDDAPQFEGSTVYAVGGCQVKPESFKNTASSSYGEHVDDNNDGRCDICGNIMRTKPAVDEHGTYLISNRAELYWFAALVNGTLIDGTAQNRSANAELTADIVINNPEGWENWNASTTGLLSWTPIGKDWNTAFQGSFDGKGHTISGLYISTTADYQGLFGVSNGSSIQNVGIESGYIKGGWNVGGIAAYNAGTIANCYNAATIVGDNSVCGIAQYNDGTIANCYNIGLVNSGSGSGIAGYSYGTVVSCYYLDTSAAGGIDGSDVKGMAEARGSKEFASGEVCWLLNNNSVWGQEIGTDNAPTFNNAAAVYKVPFVTTGGTEIFAQYGNVGTVNTLPTVEELGVAILNGFKDGDAELIGTYTVREGMTITVNCDAYSITVGTDIKHGTIQIGATEAAAGNTINVTVTPDEHYQFSNLVISYWGQSENVFKTSFVMPAADVTVSAKFIPLPPDNIDHTVTANSDGTYNVTLSWDQRSDDFTALILRDNNPVAQNISGTQWTDENLDRGTYQYEIGFVDSDDNASFVIPLTVDAWLYALVPHSGEDNVTLGDDPLPIYDDGGYSGEYSNNADGILVITAQEGCRIRLTGRTVMESYDKLIVLDSDGTTLYDEYGNDAEMDMGTIVSSGNVMTIRFISDNSVTYAGFELRAVTLYPVSVANTANGTVVPDPSWAAAGDEVSLDIQPEGGFSLHSLTVSHPDDADRTVTVTDNRFIMPAHKVVITAAFVGSTALDCVEADGAWKAYAAGRTVRISGTEAEAVIYDMAGRVVYRGLDRTVEMPVAGVYIVRVGTDAQKVLVR